MIVDDKIELLEMYKDVLEFCGHEVIALAKDGVEAVNKFIELMNNNQPDIILMDHRMPIKDGLQAAREILTELENKDMKNTTTIIFATADESIRPRANSLGLDLFIEKPFTIEYLVQVIENTLLSKS